MNTRRIAVPALLALAACALPASAQAATLAPGKPCFGDGDPITIGGTGYTPGAHVNVAADGRQFNGALTSSATGTIAGRLLPFSAGGQPHPAVGLHRHRHRQPGQHRPDDGHPCAPARDGHARQRQPAQPAPVPGPRLHRRVDPLPPHHAGRAVSNGRDGQAQGRLPGGQREEAPVPQATPRAAPTGCSSTPSAGTARRRVQRVRFRVRVFRTVRRSSAASAATRHAAARPGPQVR